MKAYTLDDFISAPDVVVEVYDTDVYAAHPDWEEWRRKYEAFVEKKLFDYNWPNSMAEAKRWLFRNEIYVNFYDWVNFYESYSFNLDGYLKSLRNLLDKVRNQEDVSGFSVPNDSNPCAFAEKAEEHIRFVYARSKCELCPFKNHCAPARGWEYPMERLNQNNLLWILQQSKEWNNPRYIKAFLEDKRLHEITSYRYRAPERDYAVDESVTVVASSALVTKKYAPQPRDKRGRFMKAVAL